MTDLFDPALCAAMLARVRGLTPAAPALWGKMDVARMLAHCQAPLEIAVGARTLKRGLIGLLFGGMARKKLLQPEPFGRNMPTAPSFKVHDRRDFATERDRLVALIEAFHQRGPTGVAPEHPFFGRLTPREWSALQWKHLDHHLRQFGA